MTFLQSIKEKVRLPRLGKEFLLVVLIIAFAIVVELRFDPIEIVIGQLLEWTNPIRPQAGTLWAEAEKDTTASKRLTEILAATEPDSERQVEVENIYRLNELVEIDGEVTVSADRFFQLYTQLPPERAQDIISPLELLRIKHSGQWVKTKILRGDGDLRVYFLDGDNQLIFDSYPPRAVLTGSAEAFEAGQPSLENMESFAGRIVSAATFFRAFENLPENIQLQIVNNPFQLLQWGDDLKRVGISRYAEQGVVPIAFEVVTLERTAIYKYEASELAANYLISNLNTLMPDAPLAMPVETVPAQAMPSEK